MDEPNKQNNASKDAAHQSPVQVNVNMQQGEHTGQPIYSNFTTVQPGQGVVFVEFGFLDPQTINALNQMVRNKPDEKTQTVHARMSCRIAISLESASQLTLQLNQFLQSTKKMIDQQRAETPVKETVKEAAEETIKETGPEDSANTIEAEEKPKSKKGFRFPWSSSDKKH